MKYIGLFALGALVVFIFSAMLEAPEHGDATERHGEHAPGRSSAEMIRQTKVGLLQYLWVVA